MMKKNDAACKNSPVFVFFLALQHGVAFGDACMVQHCGAVVGVLVRGGVQTILTVRWWHDIEIRILFCTFGWGHSRRVGWCQLWRQWRRWGIENIAWVMPPSLSLQRHAMANINHTSFIPPMLTLPKLSMLTLPILALPYPC